MMLVFFILTNSRTHSKFCAWIVRCEVTPATEKKQTHRPYIVSVCAGQRKESTPRDVISQSCGWDDLKMSLNPVQEGAPQIDYLVLN